MPNECYTFTGPVLGIRIDGAHNLPYNVVKLFSSSKNLILPKAYKNPQNYGALWTSAPP